MKEFYLSLATPIKKKKKKTRQVWEHGHACTAWQLKIAWPEQYPPPGEEVSVLHFPETARISGEVWGPPCLRVQIGSWRNRDLKPEKTSLVKIEKRLQQFPAEFFMKNIRNNVGKLPQNCTFRTSNSGVQNVVPNTKYGCFCPEVNRKMWFVYVCVYFLIYIVT